MKEYARYGLAYLLWAISIVAGSVIGLFTRDTLLNIVSISSIGRMQADSKTAFYMGLQIRAGSMWSYFLLGIILIVMVVLIEYWYRVGVPTGRLLARFFLVTAVELAILFVGHALYFFVSWATGLTTWRSAAVPAIELLGVALFIGLYLWRARLPARSLA